MNGFNSVQEYINLEEEPLTQQTGEELPFPNEQGWKDKIKNKDTQNIEEIEMLRETKSLPLWVIKSGSKRLNTKKPIKINVYKEEDCFAVENEPLDAYAVGFTLKEATENFMDHVIEFWEHYIDLPDSKAGKYAKDLKKKYRNSFIEG